jgi:hypothetical protein
LGAISERDVVTDRNRIIRLVFSSDAVCFAHRILPGFFHNL